MKEEPTQELHDLLPTIFYTQIKVHNGNKKIDEYFHKTFTKSKDESVLSANDLAKNIFDMEIKDEEAWNESFGAGVWNISSSCFWDDNKNMVLEITTENSVPHNILLNISKNISKIKKSSFITGTYVCDKGANGAFRYTSKDHLIEEVNFSPDDRELYIDLEVLRTDLEKQNL